MMDEIFVRLVDMPTTIKGMTALDEDGNYNIYINPRLSSNIQKDTLRHEMEHIKRNDFYNERTSIKEKEGAL